jgi:hypothetical protein
MKSIPCATVIALTSEERTMLETLVRSTKSEVRIRTRARIALAAAEGVATREIGQMGGCSTTGTASKRRVRYARDRLAGLEETGSRPPRKAQNPARPSRGASSPRSISPLPVGYSNGTAPLLEGALGDIHKQYIWRFLRV